MQQQKTLMIGLVKVVTLLVVLLLPLTPVMGQQHLAGKYTITLNLSHVKSKPGKIYFWFDEFVKGEKITHADSAIVSNNAVRFTGLINEPHEAFLSIKPLHTKQRVNEGDRLNFYLTPGATQIITLDSLNTYTQAGGYFNEDYQAFKKIKSINDYKIIASAIKLSRLNKLKDSVNYRKAATDFDAAVNYFANVVCKQWVIQHSSSPVALLPLRWHAGSVITNPTDVDSLYNCLSATLKTLPSAMDLKRRVDNVFRSAVGNNAPLFTMVDTAGKQISLASYHGKYILLDFWASWCAPCRRENPNVIANFNKHHSQNFMVVSVSLDNPATKDAWLKAIHTDKLEQWPHVSDLKGFNNAAALLYGVQAVPQNFLIGPNGKIIAKNLFGSALTQKLEEVLPFR